MSEMIDKVFSTTLAEQMTGFYGKQKMLRKLNNKLEMNNQQQKVVEMDQLIASYADRVALSEEGLYDDCEEGYDCPIMANENVLGRMEEILAEAYEAQGEQGEYDPWTGTRDFLEFGEAREDAYYDEYENDLLRQQLEDDLAYKERELALAKRTAEREKKRRQAAEGGFNGGIQAQGQQQPIYQEDPLLRQPQPKPQHQAPTQATQAHLQPRTNPQPHYQTDPYSASSQQQAYQASALPQPRPQPELLHGQTPQYMPQQQQQVQYTPLVDKSKVYRQQQARSDGLASNHDHHSHHHQREYQDIEFVVPSHTTEVLVPARATHIAMSPVEASHYSHQPVDHWDSYSSDRSIDGTTRQLAELQATFEADLWDIERVDRQDEVQKAMQAEAHASAQARKWERERQAREDQLRQVRSAEQEAAQQARMWQHQEEEMAGNTGLTKFERYAESLRGKDWDQLKEEREMRRSRERNLFGHKSSDTQGTAKWDSLSKAHEPGSKLPAQGSSHATADSIGDSYAPWTNTGFTLPHKTAGKKKKSGAMRWLDPDWSVVRWVSNLINPDDEEDEMHRYHDSKNYRNGLQQGGNSFIDQGIPQDMAPGLESEKQPAHAIIISSIFSSLVTLFGLYLCMKVMLPKNRFERNINLTVFYLAAFSFLIISLIPVSNDDSEVVYNFHKKWDHHPASVVGVCTEIFRIAVILFHLSSINNLFLLTIHRKFREVESVPRWATFLKEFNVAGSFVCLAFLIPLRQDFDWFLSMMFPYIMSSLAVLAMRPDSIVEIILNLVVLALAYLQLTSLFILAVFILNFKVFQFGFRKTKYVKTSADHSIGWAKKEFQDATSYLNSTLECTSDGDAFVSEMSLKREIRSYGIISIKEEKIEYIGGSSNASFILFDASDGQANNEKNSGMSHMPVIEKSELIKNEKVEGKRQERENLSDRMEPRSQRRNRSRSPKKNPSGGFQQYFNSSQPPNLQNQLENQTFSTNKSSNRSSGPALVPFSGLRRNDQQLIEQAQYEEPLLSNNEPKQRTYARQGDSNLAKFAQTQRDSVPYREPQTRDRSPRLSSNQIKCFDERIAQPSPNHRRSSQHQGRKGPQMDETKYHSQLEDYRSGAPSDRTGEEELFYDCEGRSTPNLGDLSRDDSGIMIQMNQQQRQSQLPTYDQLQNAGYRFQ